MQLTVLHFHGTTVFGKAAWTKSKLPFYWLVALPVEKRRYVNKLAEDNPK